MAARLIGKSAVMLTIVTGTKICFALRLYITLTAAPFDTAAHQL